MIEGVADTDAHEGGPLALMIKVHHAAVDGVSGHELLAQLCSPEPDSPPPDPVAGPGRRHRPRNRGWGTGEIRSPRP